jgi:hypothetical protein
MAVEAGLRRAFLDLCGRVRNRWFPPNFPTDPFDLRYGVDTSGLVEGKSLAAGHPHDRHGVSYWGTASSLFEGALAHWSEFLAATHCSIGDYTFIDIGSGKGRVVMLASDHPFHKVIGVELSPTLVSIARRNLDKWKQSIHPCNDIVLVQSDVLETPFPDSPVLLYVFNPFDAYITQLLLDRLQALTLTRTAPIDIIYTRPEYPELFNRLPNMQDLWSGDVPFSPEDAAADVYHGNAQGCSIYRLMAS